MPGTFNELYSDGLHQVFLQRAHEQLAQDLDGLTCADAYADQGKPDFALAHLLLVDCTDEIKREILARAYEQRAALSEQKAAEYDQRFHRPFPLIKLEAQKDRMSAQQVRQGRKLRRGGKALNVS